MEEKTQKAFKNRIVICPNIALTTTIRAPPATRRLIKTLSALLGIPIISRGKSNLDEIGYYVYKAGLKGFVVVYSKNKQPSRFDLYHMWEGYFQKIAYMVLGNYEIHGKPTLCYGCVLTLTEGLNDNYLRNIKPLLKYHRCANEVPLSTCIFSMQNNSGVLKFKIKGKLILTLNVRKIQFLKSISV